VPTEPIDIVVTAARRSQARVYEALIRERSRIGRLPAGTRWHVVADPDGRRVGSGTATVLALDAIAAARGGRDPFRRGRSMIIHSGGDSRRLPAFAALGKTFAPLPVGDASPPLTVFDLLVAELLRIPLVREEGVLVTSGDASVAVERSVRASVGALDPDGVIGFGIEGPLDEASRHGVYVRGAGDRVRAFLQKPSVEAMKRAGAVIGNRALVDVGLVRLSPDAANGLRRGFGDGAKSLRGLATSGATGAIDLYRHVLEALVPGVPTARYVDAMAPTSDAERRALSALHRALRRHEFRVLVVDRTREGPAAFVHAGTTSQYVDLVAKAGSPDLAASDSAVRAPVGARHAVVTSSGVRATCAGANLIVGLPRGVPPFRLPRETGVVAIPVRGKRWATIVFHARDDGKTPFAAGGTFLGRSLDRWCAAVGLAPAEVAAPDATTWDARLWTLGPRPTVPTWMIAGRAAPTAWRRARRRSLREIVDMIDAARVVAHERAVATDLLQRGDGAALVGDRWDEVRRFVGDARLVRRACRAFAAREPDSLDAARALARTSDPRDLATAFEVIGRVVTTSVDMPTRPPTIAIPHDVAVWASAPARIDLAGGWSDTPPICNELGGAVVNVAIELDGRPPVHAIAKRAERPEISVHSVDLGRSATFRTTAALLAHDDPRDWTALAKAALRLSGLAPPSPDVRLADWLERVGGGLSLSLFAAVPKGSGLGTSSILGAVTLACLDRVCGRSPVAPSLIRRTSVLEQLIATRGGWQDQVGGIVGGFKLVRSVAGAEQAPRATPIAVPPAFTRELLDHSVLCFTGLRRMARDILERVVGRYLVDPSVRGRVARMKDEAHALADAFRNAELGEVAQGIGSYWRHKVALDPQASNAMIERIVRPFERELLAWTLPGAGGGGFVLMIAKSPRIAARIRATLERRPPNRRARIVPFACADRGLTVSVL
jgi:galactokinase/mevalonate kinase-like predicted kinase